MLLTISELSSRIMTRFVFSSLIFSWNGNPNFCLHGPQCTNSFAIAIAIALWDLDHCWTVARSSPSHTHHIRHQHHASPPWMQTWGHGAHPLRENGWPSRPWKTPSKCWSWKYHIWTGKYPRPLKTQGKKYGDEIADSEDCVRRTWCPTPNGTLSWFWALADTMLVGGGQSGQERLVFGPKFNVLTNCTGNYCILQSFLINF